MRNPFTRNHLLSLISAPLIWAAHFLLCYVLVSLACALGLPGVRTGIAIVTAVALALIGFAAWTNLRKWVQARHTPTPDAPLAAFFALNALLLCGMSALALVWVAAPSAMLPLCAA